MKKIKLVIVGLGVIGKGFIRILLGKKEFLMKKGLDLEVVALCEVDGSIVSDEGINLKKTLELAGRGELDKHKQWSNSKSVEILGEVKADIVLELTPGNIENGEPGYSHIKGALKNGMHVVTSNKPPIALHYRELHELARGENLELRYEAAVGGAIPILNLHQKCLQINEVESIYGILNGTTNYVLSKMVEDGLSLENALNEAKELGIAEQDPSYDIDGVDTALKVVILANSILDMNVEFGGMKIRGIRDVTPESVELAKKHGYVIKLIGDVRRMEVSPRLIPVDHPLNVSDSLNAVMIDSDVAGELTLIGYGAGARETSSSIYSDVIEIAEGI